MAINLMNKCTVGTVTVLLIMFICYYKSSWYNRSNDDHNIILTTLRARLTQCQNKQQHIQRTENIRGYPKIIHRVWGFWDSEISEEWKYNCYISCHEHKYRFIRKTWNKTEVIYFLKQHCPWFLDTFFSYRFEVQRADAVRYFLLHHFGGIYLDMDLSCKDENHNLEAMFKAISKDPKNFKLTDAVFIEADPKPSISNFIMFSKPCDPFMTYIITQLPLYNNWYVFPYATVMFSTGGVFLTKLLHQFHVLASESVSFIPTDHYIYTLPVETFWKYINESGKHGTWHSWDADVILFCYYEGIFLIPFGCIILFLIIGCCYFHTYRKTDK